LRLRDKVAVVTGGVSGIGAATVRLFAEEGANVISLDAVEADGSLLADVRDEDECRLAMEEVARRHGCIDILVNNAGVAIRQRVDEAEADAWARVLDVSLQGAFLCSKHALRFMPRHSSIVHMSSVTGIVGVRNRAAYSAAKGALVALTKNMAMDYASRQIRVNCVCPGFVRTPLTAGLMADEERCARLTALHPLGRLGEPEDVARAVLFLASDEASWITGHALAVDGGFSAGHAVDV
jgi:NAD(P)-dependent dehydrogenase (short-subunit alcohol dehydrogenase family)